MSPRSFYGDSYYWRTRQSPWMSVAEAAHRCGMSENSVRRYARQDAFLAIQPESYIRISRISFQDWLESRCYAKANDGDE